LDSAILTADVGTRVAPDGRLAGPPSFKSDGNTMTEDRNATPGGRSYPHETDEDLVGSMDSLDDASGNSDEAFLALRGEIATLNDRHLRLAAEFDNYRKRIDRERSEIHAKAQGDLVKHLLDVLDDLQRVAAASNDGTSVQRLVEGVQLVEKKFRHALESAGLEPISAEGEFFNPATMEALMAVPADHPEEDEMVADVFQRGYRFKDALIRPARVRVKKYGS